MLELVCLLLGITGLGLAIVVARIGDRHLDRAAARDRRRASRHRVSTSTVRHLLADQTARPVPTWQHGHEVPYDWARDDEWAR